MGRGVRVGEESVDPLLVHKFCRVGREGRFAQLGFALLA